MNTNFENYKFIKYDNTIQEWIPDEEKMEKNDSNIFNLIKINYLDNFSRKVILSPMEVLNEDENNTNEIIEGGIFIKNDIEEDFLTMNGIKIDESIEDDFLISNGLDIDTVFNNVNENDLLFKDIDINMIFNNLNNANNDAEHYKDIDFDLILNEDLKLKEFVDVCLNSFDPLLNDEKARKNEYELMKLRFMNDNLKKIIKKNKMIYKKKFNEIKKNSLCSKCLTKLE
jgi:hypothetical protein